MCGRCYLIVYSSSRTIKSVLLNHHRFWVYTPVGQKVVACASNAYYPFLFKIVSRAHPPPNLLFLSLYFCMAAESSMLVRYRSLSFVKAVRCTASVCMGHPK